MGVTLSAVAALSILAAGALLIAAVEPLLVRREERGPAARVHPLESVRPPRQDPWMYRAAPIVAVLAVSWGAVVVPLGTDMVAADLSIGLFYFIVVIDYVVLAIALGGWGANTPWSVEACYRAVAQLIAYVIPLGLAILGPIMMARSMSTLDIVAAQRAAGLWYLFVQPLGFALYLVCGLMQSYRAPFLEPFARRLSHGVIGGYGGAAALLWRVALSGLLFLVAAMGAVLFLGGPSGPLFPGFVWMPLKSLALAALMTWGGARLRRLSTAEMLALSWKLLTPVGLVNVLVVGALILLGVGQSPF